MKFLSYIILRFSIFLCIEVTVAYAHINNNYKQIMCDTCYTGGDTIHLLASIKSNNNLEDMMDDSIETDLLDPASAYLKKEIKEKALLHFIESDKIKNDLLNLKVKSAKSIYSKLAKIFARKKYYPIAMQYYYETLSNSEWRYNYKDTNESNKPIGRTDVADNSTTDQEIKYTDENTGARFLSNSFQTAYFNNSQLLFASKKGVENNSVPIKNYSISETFEDGKNPVAYAIMIQVKQPKAGRRKAFTGINNVGHTFITLLKYNSDSTCVSHSFGFYPQKDNFLSATPLHPVSSSVFKDDTVHDWDEAVGKFISERRFKKLIKLITKFESKKYDLNSNNCTDFGLYAADVAGISIANTVGTWPLGHGNNPANAGQSILEGKFINTDTGNAQGLFICAGLK